MLTDVLAEVRSGKGGLVLIAGEPGVGKTRLADEVLARSELFVLRGSAPPEGTPYGPIVGVLRAYLRAVPDGLRGVGPLERYLGLLLPELGSAPERPDMQTLVESIRRAFHEIGRRDASVVFLDDLHRADEATLDLLDGLSVSLEDERLLVLAAYRTDQIPRGHPLRRLRAELRRANRFREVLLHSLDASHTAELVARILGKAPTSALATAVYERTEGLPFFIEELTAALASTRRLRDGGEVVDLRSAEDVPLPQTIRDAVLLLTDGISEGGRRALELAAASGTHVDPDVLNDLVDDDDLEELIEAGLLVETLDRAAAFHHDLVREALYRDIPWTRRRAHHRLLGERLEALGAPPGAIAEHWVAAREPRRARPMLLAAAESFFALHGYREAARALRRALEVWPEGEDEPGRLAAVERLGQCAELCGELSQAIRAYEEVAEGRRATRDSKALAEAERRLASLYELQANWERALAARASAAEEFARAGLPGEAASERLATASHLRSAGDLTAALHLITVAASEVERAGRPDLRALSLAIEGGVRAKLGQGRAGVELCREGLSLALAHDLPGVAAQAYFLMADALENSPDYPAAIDAYTAAFQFCQAKDLRDAAQVCFACLSPVLMHIGQWDRAVAVCRQVLNEAQAPPVARHAAMVELGMIHALRGETESARRLLASALAFGRASELFPMEIHGLLGLSRLDDLEGKDVSAAQRATELVERCWAKEERHYSVPSAPLGDDVLRSTRRAGPSRRVRGAAVQHGRHRWHVGDRCSARPRPGRDRAHGGRRGACHGPLRAGSRRSLRAHRSARSCGDTSAGGCGARRRRKTRPWDRALGVRIPGGPKAEGPTPRGPCGRGAGVTGREGGAAARPEGSRRPGARWTLQARAGGRFVCSSWAGPIGRSGASYSSAPGPSTCTSATSSPSSAADRASRRCGRRRSSVFWSPRPGRGFGDSGAEPRKYGNLAVPRCFSPT